MNRIKNVGSWLAAYLLFSVLILTAFESTLLYYHTPLNDTIVESEANGLMWDYLLKQHYVSFIDLDILTIHEKRHLLDIKRVLNQVHTLWLLLWGVMMVMILFVMMQHQEQIASILRHTFYLFILFSLLSLIAAVNFLDVFKLLHQLIFVTDSWVFAKTSYLIQWFPLVYFQEFFVIVFLKIAFLVLLLQRYKLFFTIP